jgi:hypothetical protein
MDATFVCRDLVCDYFVDELRCEMTVEELKKQLEKEMDSAFKSELEYLVMVPALSSYYQGRVAATKHVLNLLRIVR